MTQPSPKTSGRFKRILTKLLIGLGLIIIALVILAVVTHRPLPNRESLDLKAKGQVPTAVQPWVNQVKTLTQAHPNASEVWTLSNGQEALATRIVLASQAGQTIDAQYYIWHNDTAGLLLLSALKEASQRGVYVRLLLDDNNTKDIDSLLAQLNQLPNFEIRLFNPFMHRDHRLVDYLSDFFRLNRRMHNKSFTVDGVATVVGGRNVGDEYFGLGEGVMFADLDVLSIGQSANDVTADFNRYWQSDSVYPLANIITEPKPVTTDTLATIQKAPEATKYLAQVAKTDLSKNWQTNDTTGIWTTTHLLSDDPKKGLGKAEQSETVIGKMQRELGTIQHHLTLISPYFVPTQSGTDALIALQQQGVTIRVLTNALSATDVAPVHAGYAKYRPQLLQNNIQLYELKPDSTVTTPTHQFKTNSLTDSSGSSLHAKTFTIDGKRLFVGSFNMDPRSAKLNTEMGFIIDSPELAQQLNTALDKGLATNTYQVSLNPNTKDLQWQTQQDNQTVTHTTEPNTSDVKRLLVKMMTYLPIEWLL